MNICIDEGKLQAYLDGELSPENMQAVATHLASCADCAALMDEAEQEYMMLAAALAPALPASVPTERLRARLEAAIAELHAPPAPASGATVATRRGAWFGALAAFVSFAPQQVAAFASLLIIIVLAVVFSLTRTRPQAPQVASAGSNTARVPSVSIKTPTDRTLPIITSSSNGEVVEGADPIDDAPRKGRAGTVPATYTYRQPERVNDKTERLAENTSVPIERPKDVVLLPGEKSYLTAIATLNSEIKERSGQSLSPTLRAEYERNLAVVDQAILNTRVAARRNPQDPDANEFLRTAYQNKVELLSNVADQAQIASAR